MTSAELSSSFVFWTRSADLGCIVVIVGIFVELADVIAKAEKTAKFSAWFDGRLNPALLDKFAAFMCGKELWVEFISVALVAGGLIIEVAASHVAYGISDLQNSELNNEAGAARVTAGNAEREAGLAKERAAITESNNIALEQQMQPRLIESSKPVATLKEFAGMKVFIVSAMGGDCPATANQIGNILQSANWNVDGIKTEKAVPPGILIGMCSSNNDLHLANWATEWWSDIGRTPQHGACVALVDELNKQNVAAKIDDRMYFDTSLRFDGLVIFVGPRPDQLTAQIFELVNELRVLQRRDDEMNIAEKRLLDAATTRELLAKATPDLNKISAQQEQLRNEREAVLDRQRALLDKQWMQTNPRSKTNGLVLINVGNGGSMSVNGAASVGFFNLGYEKLP